MDTKIEAFLLFTIKFKSVRYVCVSKNNINIFSNSGDCDL